MKLFNFCAVFLGGACGASLRYILQTICLSVSWPSYMVIGFINVLGCLVFGFLSQSPVLKAQPLMTLFVFSGLLGGMTTFSSFISDTYMLVTLKQMGLVFLNVFLQVSLGLLMFYVGQRLSF